MSGKSQNQAIKVWIADAFGQEINIGKIVNREPINLFIEVDLLPVTESLAIDESVPIGRKFYLEGYHFSGTGDGKVTIGDFDSLSPYGGGFITAGNPNLIVNYSNGPIVFSSGQSYGAQISNGDKLNTYRYRLNIFGYLLFNA
jgi:hypothetical protein